MLDWTMDWLKKKKITLEIFMLKKFIEHVETMLHDEEMTSLRA